MYRRRRIVALVLLLVLVGAVAWGVTAFLGRGQGASPDAAAAADDAPSNDTTTEEPPSPGEVVACDAAVLDTSLALDPEAPAPGAGVKFLVTLTNTGAEPCLLDAGPATLVASVSSGSDAVWRSDHCPGDAVTELLLDAGAETSVAVPWDGRRSADGCSGDQRQAGTGTYRVAVTLDGEPVERGAGRVFTVG